MRPGKIMLHHRSFVLRNVYVSLIEVCADCTVFISNSSLLGCEPDTVVTRHFRPTCAGQGNARRRVHRATFSTLEI